MLTHGLNLKIIRYADLVIGYDTETMEVFQMDEIIADIIENIENEDRFLEKYPAELIQEKLSLIQEGVTSGYLSTKNHTDNSLEKHFLSGEVTNIELIIGDVHIPNMKESIPRLSFKRAIDTLNKVIQEQFLTYLNVSYVGSYDEDALNTFFEVTKYLKDFEQNIDLSYSIDLITEDLAKEDLIKIIYDKNFYVTITLTEQDLNDNNIMGLVAKFNRTLYDRKSWILQMTNSDVEKAVGVLQDHKLENYWVQSMGNSSIEKFIESFHRVGEAALVNYVESNKVPEIRFIRETIRRIGTMKGPKIFRCLSGRSKMTVYGDGDIIPCKKFFHLNGLNWGNYSKINRDLQRSMLMKNSMKSEVCSNCWCKYLCGGVCEYRNLTPNKSNFCIIIQRFSEIAIILYTLMLMKNDSRLDQILLQDI